MTQEMKASIVYANAVGALIEMEMMKAKNQERTEAGMSLAYDESHFYDLMVERGLSIENLAQEQEALWIR